MRWVWRPDLPVTSRSGLRFCEAASLFSAVYVKIVRLKHIGEKKPF